MLQPLRVPLAAARASSGPHARRFLVPESDTSGNAGFKEKCASASWEMRWSVRNRLPRSGLDQLCFMVTLLPRNIGMPDNLLCKLLVKNRKYAKHRITSQEKQQPTALRGHATDLAHRPLTYRLAPKTAVQIG